MVAVRPTLLMIVALAGFVLPDSPLSAQAPAVEGVHGHGRAEVSVRPERMVMSVHLVAKGKDVAEALEKMKGVRSKAEETLAKLGPVEGSVTFGDPGVDPSEAERREQMEAMYRSRLASRRGGKAPQVAAPVTVLMPVTATFALKGADPAAVLVEVTELQAKIRGADLAAAKSAAEVSPEEAELAEEMAQMQQEYQRRGGEVPGTPTFVFAATVPKEAAERALGEACRQARERAETLARAAGEELGVLRSLRSSSGSGMAGGDEYGEYYRARMAAIRRQPGGVKEGELVGEGLGPLVYEVEVDATYGSHAK